MTDESNSSESGPKEIYYAIENAIIESVIDGVTKIQDAAQVLSDEGKEIINQWNNAWLEEKARRDEESDSNAE